MGTITSQNQKKIEGRMGEEKSKIKKDQFYKKKS